MEFKASFDVTVKIITAAIALLFVGFIAIGFIEHNEAMSIIYAAAIPLVVIISSWLYHPAAYVLLPDRLIVRRPIGDRVFLRSNIAAISVPEAGYISAIRTFGVGGVFGYFGQFYNSSIGHMTWYATRRDKAVAIKLRTGKTIVISPDNAHQFITVFNSP